MQLSLPLGENQYLIIDILDLQLSYKGWGWAGDALNYLAPPISLSILFFASFFCPSAVVALATILSASFFGMLALQEGMRASVAAE